MESSLHEIFRRYVNDDCTEDEIRILLDFYKHSGEEKLLKELIVKELEGEESLFEPQDTNARLENVYRNLEQLLAKEEQPKFKFYKSPYLKFAASILVLIAVGGYWMMNNWQQTKSDQHPLTASVLPGSNQAMLTLGNGQAIPLQSTKDGELVSTSGGRIRKKADGQIIYEPASHSNHPEINTVRTPTGGQWQVILPDGTHVWLNASSSISYEVPFNGKERKVQLSGEAYFEVSKNSAQPFKVISSNQEVNVLGTAFNIMAYPDEPTVQTTLVQGFVMVANGKQKVRLSPGDQTNSTADKIQVRHGIDTEEAVSWKDGYFKFNSNLEEIMNRIARWYDIKIIYKHRPGLNETFEGEISRNRSLEDVLHIIEASGRVHFSINGRTVTVE